MTSISLATVSSTLYRLIAFLYLRIIPTTAVKQVMPTLFLLQLILSPKLLLKREPKSEKETEQQPQNRSWFYDILFSRATHSKKIRNVNVVLNILIAFAVLEFTLTPFFDAGSDVVFTRIGAVYPDTVKIAVRYPAPNATENTVQLLWRQSITNPNETQFPWRDGPVLHLSQEKDWIDTVKLAGLWPSTSYEYTLAHVNRTILPYPSTPISFRTFPDPRLPAGTKFNFIASSCITPNFPYVPLHGRTIKGFDYLSDHLTKSPAEFLMFLGDFIYADVPVYTGNSKEAYQRLYRRNYNSPSFRKTYERLPIFHIYDDHEILNDYEGKSNDSAPPFPAASDAFKAYNADANYDSLHKGQHYYNFQYGDSAFFVLDTRRHRSRDSEDPLDHTMLGEDQLAALYDWLGRVNSTATFKFIVSSVPFTSLWGYYGTHDSWAGYPAEKGALLQSLHSVPNVIIISGDRHEFAHIELMGNNERKINEVSTSPLSMFYIPLVRTLQKQSQEMVEGTNVQPQERVVKSIATGNYKWSTFEVDTTDRARPLVKVHVMIDNKPAHYFEIQGEPVKLTSSTALGALIPTGFKEIFDRIGMQSSRWF